MLGFYRVLNGWICCFTLSLSSKVTKTPECLVFCLCVLVGQVGMDFLAFRAEPNWLAFTSKVSVFPLSRLGKGYKETRLLGVHNKPDTVVLWLLILSLITMCIVM